MGLTGKDDMGRDQKDLLRVVLIVLGLVVVLAIIVIVGVIVYDYLGLEESGTEPVGVVNETTTPTTVAVTTTEGKSFIDSFVQKIAGRWITVDCENNESCFNEEATKCRKVKTTVDTGRVKIYKEVIGEKDDSCEVYYEVKDISSPELATSFVMELVGLNMTCELSPDDIPKDIITQVENPVCSGKLWDKLGPAVTGG